MLPSSIGIEDTGGDGPYSYLLPADQATPTGDIVAIALRHVVPAAASAQHIADAVEGAPRIDISPSGFLWNVEDRRNALPLGIGNITWGGEDGRRLRAGMHLRLFAGNICLEERTIFPEPLSIPVYALDKLNLALVIIGELIEECLQVVSVLLDGAHKLRGTPFSERRANE